MAELSSAKAKILRSTILIVIALGAGIALGGALYVIRVEPPRREVAVLPRLVETTIVQPADVVERFIGYGTARAIRSANVAAEVAGNVIERPDHIRAGSCVQEGQVLARLDERQYLHALERAEALAEAEQAALDELAVEVQNLERLIATAEQELRVAQDERARLADLFERDLAAKKEYDFANLAYQQARRVLQGYERELAKTTPRHARLAASKRGYDADAALARLNIARCEIGAPFDGRIVAVAVDLGDRVAPGSVVASLVDQSRVEIPIQIPASLYDQVKIGAMCRVESESARGAPWEGRVVRIAPIADEQTRTFAVYVEVDNQEQDQPLVPGTFVKANVHGPTHAQCILVPRSACRAGRVLVVDDGIARLRSVTIERYIEDRALVTGDLRSGDRLILSHLDQLAEGSPVRAQPALSTASLPLAPLERTGLDSPP